jgi:hypothetical protein
MSDYVVGIVGYRPSEGGTQRAVYLDSAGRQFVVDGRGRRLYGVWYVPPDPPRDGPDDVLVADRPAAPGGRPCRPAVGRLPCRAEPEVA